MAVFKKRWSWFQCCGAGATRSRGSIEKAWLRIRNTGCSIGYDTDTCEKLIGEPWNCLVL